MLVLVPMGIDLYVALLGVLWGGRTAVLVDPSADRRKLDAALAGVEVHAFAGSAKAHLLRLVLRSLRGLDAAFAPRGLWPFARGFPASGAGELRDGDPALITFTTGTTGIPKAMARSHAFLLAQHDVLAGHMGLGPEDVDLPTLPVFLLNSLAAGATCVLPDGDLRDVSSLDPARLVAQVAAHGVTTTSGSPAFFRTLVDHVLPGTLPLRKVFVGGAKVRMDLLADMVRAFPGARVEVVYGSTEAEPIATLDAREAMEIADDTQGSCVGRPVPGIDVRLDGEGEVGEVCVSGAHVNTGYFRNPEADRENKVRDGDRVWHRTGDAAWRDEHGRLWLVGRVTDAVGGLYPFRVEARAEAIDGVARAALVDVGGALVAYEGTAAEAEVAEATGVAARRVEKIPVDPRHRAKVDREALKTILRGF